MNIGAESAEARPLDGENEWLTEGAWEAPAAGDDTP